MCHLGRGRFSRPRLSTFADVARGNETVVTTWVRLPRFPSSQSAVSVTRRLLTCGQRRGSDPAGTWATSHGWVLVYSPFPHLFCRVDMIHQMSMTAVSWPVTACAARRHSYHMSEMLPDFSRESGCTARLRQYTKALMWHKNNPCQRDRPRARRWGLRTRHVETPLATTRPSTDGP